MIKMLIGVYYIVLAAICLKNSFAYIEIIEEEGNETRMFLLTCRHLHSTIAILEAKFHPEEIEVYQNSTYPFLPENPRIALNKRCSGVNHCSFILNKDCPGADRWGPGHFYIKYACVSERQVHKYCNRDIKLESHQYQGIYGGFLHNPGYPRFYLGIQKCHWKLIAPPLRRVRIVILDLSIIGPYNDNKCTDKLEIIDSDNVIYSSCDQTEPPKEITSTGDSLDIKLITHEILIPRRGILIQYTAVGCETPLPPKHGYLVYRNDTTAVFSCCIGYIFAESKSRILNLICLGRAWNYKLPLPECKNISENNQNQINIISLGKPPETMESYSVTDIIVVPSLVIIALFVINAIVIFFIYRYKQRKNALYTEEELNPIPYTNGNDTP